ncbi:MAG: multiphosphoryl transfer protein [Cryptosporangiaceae bacterium]|nr:multiphosphoryl transfer protein [Cryptosporangiaceae bacterium]
MTGIVVVSHSRALARAAVALAEEMVHGQAVRIEIAAGLDETTFGTDAVRISEAIAAADRGEGTVVLMDLGSAVLSAELALDLLDDEIRSRAVLCAAPLVEGLVVAAVAAAGGASAQEVAAEAGGALAGKQSHFGTPAPALPAGTAAADGLTGEFTVDIPHGLHARPAARLVAQARAFDAQVDVRNRTTGSAWVPASSLSRVATLGALAGHVVEIRASGAQAAEALDHVLALAAHNFGEDMSAPVPAVPAPVATGPGLAGVAASPGIGVGPVWIRAAAAVTIPDVPSLGAAPEWRRLREAIAAVRRVVQRVRVQTARAAGDTDAAIFDAHLLLLDDVDLLGDVRERIESGQAAAPAWAAAIDRIAAEFGALTDPYLQARAADVRAVGDQVLRAVLGENAPAATGSGVLVAADLTPAEAAELDPASVTGVLLAHGSATSHAAILARARGIPAVAGIGAAVLAIPPGTAVALDGSTGEVVVDPPPDVLAAFRDRAAGLARRRDRALAGAGTRAVTQDGTEVLVGANLGSVADAAQAARSGADLAGLVRTEFLFLGRTEAPTVDEQEAVYRKIAEALGGRRITLRTLDAGGDKPLGYVPQPREDNPFLGIRGLRHSLLHPALISGQLLAMVRIARETPVSIMFPMVSTVAEVIAARRLLDTAIALAGSGTPAGLAAGIMVEVPAAALKARALGRHVDFFSIGTNDLTQYTLAAERGNPELATLSDGLDPAVLRLIGMVCREGGVPVSVCGELAADEDATALLTGLGVRELSVSPRAIPLVKDAIRGVDLKAAADLAARALDAAGPAEVRALVGACGPPR